MIFKRCVPNIVMSMLSLLAFTMVAETVTPVIVGSVSTNGCAMRVHVVGNYAYVSNGFNAAGPGLAIVDITNPMNPVLVAKLATSNPQANVVVSGNYAYMSNWGNGLGIYNISNPASPILAGTFSASGGPYGVAVAGNYAYVSDFYNYRIVNIANPSSPVQVGSITSSGSVDSKIVGNYAYVAENNGGKLKILDISNPASPTVVSSIDCHRPDGVDVVGNYAYIADGDSGIKIINISNPTAPSLVGSLATTNAIYVCASGNYAYVADRTAGLKVVNVSNVAAPVLVGSLSTNDAIGVQVVGNYAYVADGTAGLKIIRIGNDAPVVSSLSKSGDEDSTVAFAAADFTSHYSDADNDAFTKIKITSLPANGTLKLSGVAVTLNQEINVADLNNLTFEPVANWNGNTSFSWNGFDGMSYAASSADVIMTMANIEDAPVVSSFSKSSDEDTTIAFTAADFTSHFSDVDNNGLVKIRVLSLPNDGTLKLSNVAVILNQEINATDLGNLTFVPNDNWNGNTSFSWNGLDGFAYAATPADITITVNAVDDVPIVTPIAKSINEDGMVTFTSADFTGHFSDVENEGLSKIQITSLPGNGTLKLSGTSVTLNQEIVSADLDNLTFEPDGNWNGTINFDWKGCDVSACSDLSNITVTVSAVNDAPVVSSLSKSVDEDGTVTFTASDFTSHFSDVDNDTLTKIQVLSLPSNGTLKLSNVAVVLNQEINTADLDNLMFVPDANWNGNTSFSWNGFDGSAYAATPASVAFTVVSVDDAPVITSFSKSVDEDGVVTFTAADFSDHMTDVEGESLTKIQVLSLPANGTLKLSGVAVTLNQEINAADLGNLTFVPDANWNGNTNFIWNGFDGSSYAAATAQVVMTITAVDDAPEITSFTKSADEDTTVTFAVTDFSGHMIDVETESLTKIQVLSLPSNGTLKLSGIAVVLNQEINVADLNNLTFVPNINWNGNTSFIWNGHDGSAYAVSSANAAITITAVNDAPGVASFSKAVDEDGTLTFTAADFTNHFSDVDGNALTRIQVASLPSNGALKLSSVAVILNQEINVADLNNLTFEPEVNWNGNTSFSWNGFDGSAYAVTPAEVTITVNAVDDVPVVTPIAKSVNEDGVVTFNAADFTSHFSDTEGEGLAKIQITRLPNNGTLKLSGVAVELNQQINTSDLNNLTFEPVANWNGNTSFGWKGCDATACSKVAVNADITVAPVADVPVVSQLFKTGEEDTPLHFNVVDFTGHFTDADGNGLTAIQLLSLPEHGTLKLANVSVVLNQEIIIGDVPALTFEPETNWNGNTSFSWNGCDGTSYAAASANVTITITSVNDAPVISTIEKSGNQDAVVALTSADFTNHFSDIEHNGLAKVQILSLPEHGALKLDNNVVVLNQEIPVADLDKLAFEPVVGWYGATSFAWNGSDGVAYAAQVANVNIALISVPVSAYCSEHPVVCYVLPPVAVAAGTLASAVLYMSKKHMGCFRNHEVPTVPTRAVAIEMPKV